MHGERGVFASSFHGDDGRDGAAAGCHDERPRAIDAVRLVHRADHRREFHAEPDPVAYAVVTEDAVPERVRGDVPCDGDEPMERFGERF